MYNFLGDIAKLLQSNSCVILPGIGAFITNYQSAEISFIDNQITPPSYGLSFNELVHQNDGLLINWLSTSQAMPYNNAQTAIFQFCDLLNTQLKMHEIIDIPSVGSLHKSIEGPIVFKSYTKNRIPHLDYFGLEPIKIEPILRQDRVGVIKEFVNLDNTSKHETLTHQPTFAKSKKYKISKIFEIAAAALFAIFILASILTINKNKKDYIQSANIISCFLGSLNNHEEKLTTSPVENFWVDTSSLVFFKQIRQAITDTLIEKKQDSVSVNIESIAKDSTIDQTTAKQTNQINKNTTNQQLSYPKNISTLKHHYSYYLQNPALPYYMIVGQFESKEQAQIIKNILRNNGEDARIVQYDKIYCVGLFYFVNKKEADSILAQLVSNRFASAFIISAVQ